MAKLTEKPIRKTVTNKPVQSKVQNSVETLTEPKRSPKVETVIVIEHGFKDKILDKVDRLIAENDRLFERKLLNRQEIELILNSVFN